MAAARMRENAFPEVQDDTESSPRELDPEADAEAARRRTIAERMAKLGGVKFGVPVTSRPSPIRKYSGSREATEMEATETRQDPDMDVDSNQSPEETERARRAGIAARMAAMGGRGFGMYGAGAAPTAMPSGGAKTVVAPSHGPAPNASLASPPPPPLPGSRPKRHSRDDVAHAITRPPPPAPTNDLSGSTQSGETSESEVEMINPETEEEGEMVEVEDEEPELVETPPAPPNRSGRPPIPAASRPALPPPSSELAGPSFAAGRSAYPPPSLQSDYEVANDEFRASTTVPRVTHSRSIPPPIAESASHPSMDSSGQWELPNIPSGSFDLGNYGKGSGATVGTSTTENEASWTKVEQEESGARAKGSTSDQPPSDPFIGPAPTPISTEALTSLAHRMGPTIVSSAQHLYEKSKKTVIGDGSSTSFLLIVLSSVSGTSTTSLGHLVYAQTGGAVQRRLGDIMPGDVVALYDARFKGHKGGLGLGAYSASWGSKEEPVLGIITEFEGKKNKIRAFAVNQHPNSYPVSFSYKRDR
jgi:myosin tail region-interacting protein MTI1